jgi:transmembrane sensor
MDENNYRELVKRYLNKKATDEELEVFVHLMKQGKLDRYIQEFMNDELGLNEQLEYAKPSKRSYITSLIAKLSIAAVLLLVIGLSIYLIISNRQRSKSFSIASTAIENTKNGITDTTKVLNATGYINKIVLPDGSAVWLQPKTKICFPAKFNGNFRSVSMSGEAFFEVTKDHAHPFVITAGKVLTKVWGTSFSIKAIAGHKTKVTVLTGKVSVSIPGMQKSTRINSTEVMLMPSEEVVYQPASGSLEKNSGVPSTNLIIWKKSDLSFENTRLSSVIKALNTSYNVHISTKDARVNNYQISADFGGKNLADILLLICKSVHISYTKNNNEILLSNIN